MINYYELLEIPQTADKATIEQAIKKIRRVWNNRANNPDATIRAEAERKVKEIAQAEKILLNDAKRQEYNSQLNNDSSFDISEQQGTEDADWEAEYFRAYNRDMNDYAAQIAQQIIHTQKKNGRAWFLYGEALRRGGNIQQGIDALKHASFLLDDAEIFRQLGFAYNDANQLNEALIAFMTAIKLNPNVSEYHALAANCLRSMGKFSEAIEEAKTAYSLDSNDGQAKFELFVSLYEDAMRAMSYNRSSGKHLIINKKQLNYVNNLLETMSVVVPKEDARCTKALEEVVRLAVDAEKYKGAGLFSSGKPGYQYNYEISNADTRSTGLH